MNNGMMLEGYSTTGAYHAPESSSEYDDCTWVEVVVAGCAEPIGFLYGSDRTSERLEELIAQAASMSGAEDIMVFEAPEDLVDLSRTDIRWFGR